VLKKFIIIILSSFLLGACQETDEFENPAEKQIQDYNKKLEDCKESASAEAVQKEEAPALKPEPAEEKKPRGLKVEPDDIVFGEKNSKVVVVEYFSPTCPHCVSYQKRILPHIKEKYVKTGKIAYVVREFISNKQDLDATLLARCVSDELEKYTHFMTIIMNKQDSWAFNKNYREILTNIGILGGISPQQYAKCLNDRSKIQTLMQNTKLLSQQPKFYGTPAFFINGVQYTDPYTFEGLSKAIDDAIANSEK
jgi:protein-disulfide isomerase